MGGKTKARKEEGKKGERNKEGRKFGYLRSKK